MAKKSKDNPLIDTGNVTVNAFNAIKSKEKNKSNYILGRDDKKSWESPNFKVKVKAWTKDDKQTHTYFHSLSIDVNVEDFMGTAELKCPYDSDLMEYWEPIRQTVVIYGANRGDYKILFIGRVRGVKQDGYELVIEFQNYGWKFKQLVTQSYANDNVLNKNGYTIMRLMFEALKIDSYVISESAKKRLKQVGINSDGNLTLNGKEVEEMPDLLKRLEASDPSKLVNKNSLNNKLREKYLHNIEHINYTLKYEKPSKVMQKIASEGGGYSSGGNIYSNPYGSASAQGGGGDGTLESLMQQASGTGACNPPAVTSFCPSVPSSLWGAIQAIYMFNRECKDSYGEAEQAISDFARNNPATYMSQVEPCLKTMAKYTVRKDGRNAAQAIKDNAYWSYLQGGANKTAVNAARSAVGLGVQAYNSITNTLGRAANNVVGAFNNFVSGVSRLFGGG